jgi:hypothetical protein
MMLMTFGALQLSSARLISDMRCSTLARTSSFTVLAYSFGILLGSSFPDCRSINSAAMATAPCFGAAVTFSK